VQPNYAPQGQYQPPHDGHIPATVGGAHINLSDDASVANSAATPQATTPHRPTVNFAQPPMNEAQTPANYVFPPAQSPTTTNGSQEMQEAPLPGEAPAYLRGQPTTAPPANEPSRGSRWSD
jgi:hypothetical protein